MIGLSLGFAAGVFMCIALADILPELQFHRHDRMKLSAALMLGVLFAYAIGFVESPHQHGHETSPSDSHAEGDAAQEGHDDHDHTGHNHP